MRHRLRLRGWLFVHAVNLILLAVFVWQVPAIAGLVAAAVWVPTVLAPMLGVQFASKLIATQRYTAARRLCQVLAVLHPFDGWREQPAILKGMEFAQKGHADEARALWGRAGSPDSWFGCAAQLHLFRLDFRWADLRSWVEGHARSAELLRDVTVVSFYIRALGELGEVRAALRASARAAQEVEGSAGLMPLLTLYMASFAGKADLARKVLGGALSHYPKELRDFWLATALQTAGREEEARDLLVPLAERGSPLVTRASAHRLESPLAAVDPAALDDAESREDLARLTRAVAEGYRDAPSRARPVATYAFLLLNVYAFLREVPGGTKDTMNLYRLGALWLSSEGSLPEVWRLVSAGFLHYGAMHLVMNLLGLWLLGQRLERTLGWARFTLIYLGTGVGSSALYVLWARLLGGAPTLLVGASGSVMGVVGATAAGLLGRWFRDRARLPRQEQTYLLSLGMVLALQAVFDLVTPQVAMMAHIGGTVTGLALGAVLGQRGAVDVGGGAPTARGGEARWRGRRQLAAMGASVLLGIAGFEWSAAVSSSGRRYSGEGTAEDAARVLDQLREACDGGEEGACEALREAGGEGGAP